MRHYLKTLIISAISFYLVITLIPTITLGANPQNWATAVGGVILTSIVIHPIFSIILLPINILTFGLLSLILNISLFLAYIKFLPEFSISAYNFPGANIQGFIIPQANLNQIETLVAAAIILTFSQKVLHIIFD